MKLNLTQAGNRLGISRETIKRLIQSGELKALRERRTGLLKVEESELDRYEQDAFETYNPATKCN